MSSLLEFAKNELEAIENSCEDEESKSIQRQTNFDILQIIRTFSEQGHTGFTASYVIAILEKLLKYQPLTPIEDKDDEWIEVGNDLYQHKRCFSVFKNKNGAFNSEGKVFSEDGGKTWFTNKDSRIPITFPYEVPSEPIRVILK